MHDQYHAHSICCKFQNSVASECTWNLEYPLSKEFMDMSPIIGSLNTQPCVAPSEPCITTACVVLPPNLAKSRSREIRCYKSAYRSEIRQASLQRCWRGVCQFWRRLATSTSESRGFETSRYLAVGRPSAWLIKARVMDCWLFSDKSFPEQYVSSNSLNQS